jgi:hypothetical protein
MNFWVMFVIARSELGDEATQVHGWFKAFFNWGCFVVTVPLFAAHFSQ